MKMDTNSSEICAVLNPRGIEQAREVTSLSPRLPDFKGKTIFIVDMGKQQSDIVFDALEEFLPALAPEAKFVRRQKTLSYFEDEPELWHEIEQHGDAFIIGAFD